MNLSPFQKFDEASNETTFSRMKLFEQVQASWPLLTADETDHGPDHWKRVHTNARTLLELEGFEDCQTAFEAVELFAMFHDSQRVNDDEDHCHGRRAAESMMRFVKLGILDSAGYRKSAIYIARLACEHHTSAIPRDKSLKWSHNSFIYHG